VRWNGMIKWRGEEIFIGEALAGELIGLAEHASGGTSHASAIAISWSSIATAVSCALLRRMRGYASRRKRR
jgi:CRP-like cAMP-binding protein